MPLTEKGEEILANFKREYGEEKGERYFYASKNAGKISGVDSDKLAKESVDYSEGKGEERCRNCVHFEKPDACALVEGKIDPEYWCKKFEASRSDGLSDDLRDLKSRLAQAKAENHGAVAKALEIKIEELEGRLRGASPEERGDAAAVEKYLRHIDSQPERGDSAREHYNFSQQDAESFACDAEWNESDHPRDEDGQFSETGDEGTSEKAPIQGGHHRLSNPLKIERETEKAYGTANEDYEAAKREWEWSGPHGGHRLTQQQREAWNNRESLKWYPKSQTSAHEGYIHGMAPWLASKSDLMTEEREAKREQAFESGKAKYQALLAKAREAGVPGIRERMKTETIKEKMRAHGVAVDSSNWRSKLDVACAKTAKLTPARV